MQNHSENSVSVGASLARRIEEASLNAWPALQQNFFDGWLLRFSRGFTKRANCVVPLYPSSLPLGDKVRYCENIYARERLSTIFRLTTLQEQSALDEYLAERGYQHLDHTRVMALKLQDGERSEQIRRVGLDEWLRAYQQLTGMPDDATTLHAAILKSIGLECAFGLLVRNEQAAACGLAVVEHELVGLFDVVTHVELRGQGYGRTLVNDLIHWGCRQGATHAYLQVVARNAPAINLYNDLGFQEAYSYWYRAST